ncbi:MAG: integrase core domain-containing protein, partial [Lysobacter sp.]
GACRLTPLLATAKNGGITITHCPQQNGMVERVIRTLKEQCAHRHRFETRQHATRVIGDWIQFYNHRRPHQALGMKTPAEAYALAV